MSYYYTGKAVTKGILVLEDKEVEESHYEGHVRITIERLYENPNYSMKITCKIGRDIFTSLEEAQENAEKKRLANIERAKRALKRAEAVQIRVVENSSLVHSSSGV